MKRLQIRLDTDSAGILESIAVERGISQSKAINEILKEHDKEKREAADIRAAVASARAAESQGRILEGILNSMMAGFTTLEGKTYKADLHPIVEGARKAEAQARFDRMKGKNV